MKKLLLLLLVCSVAHADWFGDSFFGGDPFVSGARGYVGGGVTIEDGDVSIGGDLITDGTFSPSTIMLGDDEELLFGDGGDVKIDWDNGVSLLSFRDSSDALWLTFSPSSREIRIGRSNGAQGRLELFSGPTLSTEGGQILLQVAPDWATSVDTYIIQVREDELRIGPELDFSRLIYNSDTDIWTFNTDLAVTDSLTVGVDDTDQGSLALHGEESGFSAGGVINLFTAADFDPTINFYQINVDEDDLEVGPNTDSDALKYDGGTDSWIVTSPNGWTVGVTDTTPGIIIAKGDTTSSTVGGILRLEMAADHDATIDYFQIEVAADSIQFGPDTDPNSFTYIGTSDTWAFSNANGVLISNTLTVSGSIAANGGSITSTGDIDLAPSGGEVQVSGALVVTGTIASVGKFTFNTGSPQNNTVGGNLIFSRTDGASIIGTSDNFNLLIHANNTLVATHSPGGDFTTVGDIISGGDVEVGGDLRFSSGGGMLRAGISAKDVTDTVSVGAGVANKGQVTAFDTNDASGGATPDHTNDHITIITAGDYLIMGSVTVASSGSTALYGMSVWINNGATEITNVHNHRQMAGGGGDTGSASLGGGFVTLAASDTVEIWIWNDTNAEDPTISDVVLSVLHVGTQ